MRPSFDNGNDTGTLNRDARRVSLSSRPVPLYVPSSDRSLNSDVRRASLSGKPNLLRVPKSDRDSDVVDSRSDRSLPKYRRTTNYSCNGGVDGVSGCIRTLSDDSSGAISKIVMSPAAQQRVSSSSGSGCDLDCVSQAARAACNGRPLAEAFSDLRRISKSWNHNAAAISVVSAAVNCRPTARGSLPGNR